MKNLILISMIALGLSACTGSRDLKEDEGAVTAEDAKQVEIVTPAAASETDGDIEPEIEEEEETVVVEDVNEQQPTPSAELAAEAVPAAGAYGVSEEIEFSGDAYADQYAPTEIRESDVYQSSDIFVDEPMAIEVEETAEEIIAPASSVQPEITKGFYYFASDCPVRLSPATDGELANVIPKGKMLWVEEHGDAWAKVYRRSGPAYVEKECLYHD